MKLGIALATLTGLGAMVALLVYNDAPAIFRLVGSVGQGLLLVVLTRACILVLAGMAWERLVRAFVPMALRVYLLLRWIRESINVLLPVAQVGGDLVGGRLLAFWPVSGGLAGASILVDLLIQVAAQFVFTALGLAVLALSGADARVVDYVASGLSISAVALFGFYFVQRSSLLGRVEDRLIRIAKGRPSFAVIGSLTLHENLRKIHRRPGSLIASFILHQVAWLTGVVEIWIALSCLGQQPGWGECLVLESLGQAVRSADFAVPGVMGVQEGGFLVIGRLYGIGPEIALALSLVKRVPDLALGLPGLLAWHVLEVRRARQLRTSPAGSLSRIACHRGRVGATLANSRKCRVAGLRRPISHSQTRTGVGNLVETASASRSADRLIGNGQRSREHRPDRAFVIGCAWGVSGRSRSWGVSRR